MRGVCVGEEALAVASVKLILNIWVICTKCVSSPPDFKTFTALPCRPIRRAWAGEIHRPRGATILSLGRQHGAAGRDEHRGDGSDVDGEADSELLPANRGLLIGTAPFVQPRLGYVLFYAF